MVCYNGRNFGVRHHQRRGSFPNYNCGISRDGIEVTLHSGLGDAEPVCDLLLGCAGGGEIIHGFAPNLRLTRGFRWQLGCHL